MIAVSGRVFRRVAVLGLVVAACNSGGGKTSASGETGAETDATTGTPTTSGSTSAASESSGAVSATGTASTGVDATETGAGTTQGVDPSTGDVGTGTSEGASTGTASSTGGSTGDGSSTGGDTMGCVPTEMQEVTCDHVDNDCDGKIDNIDAGNDGICDCLNIGILGSPGFAPNSNFETWLESKGSSVTRTSLMGNPDVVKPAFLANYDLVLIDRIERALSPAEAAALEAFVKAEGRGVITLIGYNFDNNNPAPERDRANTALAPFGLAYEGPYFGDAVIPTFDQNHPVSQGIVDVNFAGGIEPRDNGNQGASKVFATVLGKNAGLAHQTMMGVA